MKKVIFILLSFALYLPTASAIDNLEGQGAQGIGLGQASISLQDLWSIVNNQAGIAFVDDISLGVSYEERFRMKEMGLKTVALIFPTNRIGNFGMSYTHFGDADYNETRLNIGYARKLGEHFAMGLAFDYLEMSVSGSAESGSTGTFTGELGIMGEPLENLWLSAHIYNPFSIRINDYEFKERIPTLLRLGLLYNFTEQLFFVAEIEKDMDYDARVKAGISYTFLNKFIFRGGVATQPTEYSAGFGLLLQNFHVDLACYHHQYLGYTPSIAISYNF